MTRTTAFPRAAAVLVAALALAGCGGATPEPAATRTVTPEVEPSRTAAPEPEVPVVWPLTGVPVDEVPTRPAVAVKVENTAAARPQTGLEDADVVWETVVEFEVSRFVAVFHSVLPAEVGPIRSVRPMDVPIAEPLRGLIAFSGGQRGILDLVAKSDLQALSHDAGVGGMYRSSNRRAPHNVYGSLETFVAAADDDHSAPPPEQFRFAQSAETATAVLGGADAMTLSFRLSGQARPQWTWDAGSGRWLRTDAGSPATSADGDRLSAVNVVSITAEHVPSGFKAQGGAPVPTYRLGGASGEGLVATGGKVLPVRWSKESDSAPIVLTTVEGDPVQLAPGNTWVELVPAPSGSVAYE